MDWLGWIGLIVGLGTTFAANIAALAYQAGQINKRMDSFEEDMDETKEELKELRPVKAELSKMSAILERLETRFNNYLDHTMARKD